MSPKKKTRKFYRKGKTQRKTGSRFLSFFILVLGLVVLVYTFSFVKRLTQTEAIGSPEPTLIKLEVLNGCGIPGAAQEVANYMLRQEFEGFTFDVIEVGNFSDSQVPQTSIWDRVGNLDAALKVAQLLHISKENVTFKAIQEKRLKVLGIQQTLILGKDYRKIFDTEKP